jgi:uncharacterized membrane protein YhaH (DUF805 family)
VHHYVEGWKRYTDFKDRLSRPAYWWLVLISRVITFVLSLIPLTYWTWNKEKSPPEGPIIT